MALELFSKKKKKGSLMDQDYILKDFWIKKYLERGY